MASVSELQGTLHGAATGRAASGPKPESKGVFRDLAFMSNRTAPMHRWVPWIAGFSKTFVEDALNRHVDGHGTVLDPFAGVGTTLVEADISGCSAVGFEINPYAVFACRTKLSAHRMDTGLLRTTAADFGRFMEGAESGASEPRTRPPDGFRTHAPFYSPKVLRKVLLAQDFMAGLDGAAADIFRLAFAATMVEYSNYSYEPSLGRRSAAGRADIPDFQVSDAIYGKVSQMADDSDWYGRERADGDREDGRVLNRSFLDGYRDVPPQSVDLLVTSPPYLNNYHYNRNTRPHLYWLGFCGCPGDMKRLESLNFGTYWQNARDEDRIDLDESIRDREIRDTLERLRGRNPDKGLYGGGGWANYAAKYLNDCARFASGMERCLRPGAAALVVIGNSILQGVHVPTDRFLARIAESCGLEVVDIHGPRVRIGDSTVGSAARTGNAAGRARLYESVVELRRPWR